MISDLRVDGLASPMGLGTPTPRLSWRLQADRRGAGQSAYRIAVAGSRARLADNPDLWDSGKIVSSENLDVPYGGKPIGSRAKVWWRVEVWDETGAQAGAAESAWEMGLLEPSDWTAEWIAAETELDRADREAGFLWVWGQTPRPANGGKFRFRFSIPESAEGVLMVGATDRLEGVWIDGRSYPVLQPAPIDFAKPPLTEIPISLSAGEHVIAAEASVDLKAVLPSATGAFGALLRLRLADGRTLRMTTREGWRTGEAEDDRWRTRGFDDAAWSPVQALKRQPNVPWPARPAVLMRRAFTAEPGLVSARLYATALGAYEASINGTRIDDALLAPEYTDFRARTPCRTYDVTRFITAGENALGVLVGDGWFASVCAPLSRFPFAPAPRRLLAQLELSYGDGRRVVVGTDDGWRLRNSPVLSSEIYDGERYDARLEVPGWDAPGADLAGWEAAAKAEAAPGRLEPDVAPPVRRVQTLEPVKVGRPGPKAYVFDFGQNFAGVPLLTLTAPAGTEVTLRFAEVLKPDGHVDQANLRAAKATDVYVCRGGGVETYQPHFTFHGFRYVEVTGLPGPPAPDTLRAAVIHSDLPFTGRPRIEDPLIEGIWRNAFWSQRSNFVSVPTDCPQRDERLGWTGDAMAFWDAACFNMDVAAFTRRFLGEVRIAQHADGGYPIFAPAPSEAPASLGSLPGWADAGVILPWFTWRSSGCTAVIDEHWDSMVRYLASIHAANPDFLWLNKRGLDLGDWLAVDAKAPSDATTPKDLIGTAFWGWDCALMGEMAAATGRTEEARRYADLHAKIAAAFREAFVKPDGTVGNGSQTSYILPIRFGLLTPEQQARAGERLATAVRARGVSLTTGFLGTPFALDALAETGRGDLAIALLRRTEFPSWGYMLSKGATTMWERWNSDTGDVAMNSYNHYAFGSVAAFIMRRLVGIEAAEAGFRRIRVRPLVGGGSTQGGGDYISAQGKIATDWRLDTTGGFRLSLTVPANAVAEVHLPPKGAREGGRPVEGRKDVRVLSRTDEAVVVEVASGRYDFQAQV